MKSTIKTIEENESGGAESLCQPESYADSLYYPLFPPILTKTETYQLAHDKLMTEMRERAPGIVRRLKKLEKNYTGLEKDTGNVSRHKCCETPGRTRRAARPARIPGFRYSDWWKR